MIDFMEKKMAFYESKEDESLDPLTRQHFEGEYIEILNIVTSEELVPQDQKVNYMLYQDLKMNTAEADINESKLFVDEMNEIRTHP